jgi:hypothetical protein
MVVVAVVRARVDPIDEPGAAAQHARPFFVGLDLGGSILLVAAPLLNIACEVIDPLFAATARI